ncbi:tetratricopeptide repeat protein [Streptomyces cavernae]|uniref:tetratricopeptide repeat protein n=1 Tax=Streptomyces cavernae TaxID=2259034 RepID=UPI000FEBB55E|nr:tetratricopeptide repeat protein [Streptomyces cavernae]
MAAEHPRFSLVAASQHEGQAHLPFLDEAARDLDAVLRDPLRGACAPALTDGGPLLVNAGKSKTYDAVAGAAERASNGGLLILAWIGHGLASNGNFYVLPHGCALSLGHSHGPYGLTFHIKELLTSHPRLSLILLIDACFSGQGAAEAATSWVDLDNDLRRRFQVLTAANIEDPAYDCAFSRAIAARLRTGHIAWGETLTGTDLKREVERVERRQQPALVTLDGSKARPELWVAHNAALGAKTGSLPAFSPADLAILRPALRFFRPTPPLTAVVAASRAHRYVVVQGPAGSGKTTTIGALTRPEVAPNAVPEGFVNALRLLKSNEDAGRVARHLAKQLAGTVDGFRHAQTVFQTSVPRIELDRMTGTERYLLGPLRHLPAGTEVRIILDGFDQLSDVSAEDLRDLLGQVHVLSRGGPDVRLVVSSRPDVTPHPSAYKVSMDKAPESELRAYLSQRKVQQQLHDAVVASSSGGWLVASLLADYVTRVPDLEPKDIPSGLAAVYDGIFDQALEGGAAWDEEESALRAALTVLVAAGPGAVLPLPALLDACQRLGVPSLDEAGLGKCLAPLRRYIMRAAAGQGTSSTMLYGLFHQSLVDYLAGALPTGPGAYGVDVVAGHRALASSLATLAAGDKRTPANAREPLYDYAERAEPDHLWRCGAYKQIIHSLKARLSAVPRENLQRWQRWHQEFTQFLAPDDPNTLTARHEIAYWTGEAGKPDDALKLYSNVLEDRIRVLGPDDPDTLATRHGIARWTGEAGNPDEALKLYTELFADAKRALGSDPLLFLVRHGLGFWTGEAGKPEEALKLYKDLLNDRIRILGPDDPDTLATRHNLAHWTGETGKPEEALKLYKDLLNDRIRVLGPDHPSTLATRHNLARRTGETGKPEEALKLYKDLLKDRIRVLGPDHPKTLATRRAIAHWTRQTRGREGT